MVVISGSQFTKRKQFTIYITFDKTQIEEKDTKGIAQIYSGRSLGFNTFGR